MKNVRHTTRILSSLLIGAMLVSFTACGKAEEEQGSRNMETNPQAPSSAEESFEETEQAGTSTAADGNVTENITENGSGTEGQDRAEGNKILIAYFTAAENSGVDAIASASYTMIGSEAVGRVRAVADMIQTGTGGDLFSIQTSTVYPADGGALIDQAAEEQDADFRPELTSHIENLEDYNMIFIGFPNWWYDMPMVMYSFFEEYDFSGKTIIPFNVHNGSRFSSTIRTIQELEPEATVIEDGFTVSERTVAEAESDVQEWLENLGY